jgi:hypothetical protein
MNGKEETENVGKKNRRREKTIQAKLLMETFACALY